MPSTLTERGIAMPSGAARLATGMSSIGGAAVARETVRASGASIRDHVVHLAPGLSDNLGAFAAIEPRVYTAVEPDPVVAAAVRARGVAVVEAPVHATGLPGAEATVVILEGVLCGLPDDDVAAVLAEAERLLAPRGRLVVREVAGDGVAAPDGRRARDERWWRAAVDAAGLEPAGSFSAPLGAVDDPWPAVRRSGPRAGLRLGPALAREMGSAGAGERLRRLRTADAGELHAVVILAQKPVFMGMRWPEST